MMRNRDQWAGTLRAIVTGLALFATTVNTDASDCPPNYEVTIISGPGCELFGSHTLALGVNNNYEVVGYYWCGIGPERPFYWSEETGILFPSLPDGFTEGRAHDVNDKGEIVGSIRGPLTNWRGFYMSSFDVKEMQVTEIPVEGNTMELLAINESGTAAGYWLNNLVGPRHALTWTTEDGIFDLAPWFRSESHAAQDLNDSGQITGCFTPVGTNQSAGFLWDKGKLIELPEMVGGFALDPSGINNESEIVGRGKVYVDEKKTDWEWRAFVWRDGVVSNLGVLPQHLMSVAYDLNDRGQIVGDSAVLAHPGEGDTDAGVLWDETGIHDLQDLIPDDSELNIQSAKHINELGAIVGVGEFKPIEMTQRVAYLLIPTPSPLSDLDDDCDTDFSDLLLLLDAWGTDDNAADLDGSGVVDFTDLLVLLDEWSARNAA